MPGSRSTSLCASLLLLLVATSCDGWLWPAGPSLASADAGASVAPASTSALTRPNHLSFFPIGPGSKHADISCDSCHERSDSFSEFTCLTCHAHAEDVAQTRHLYITEFTYRSTACFNCHPTGWEAAISVKDHSAKYFAIDTPSHQPLLCVDCHTDRSSSKPFSCITCHAHETVGEQTRHAGVANYQYQSGACLACHPNNASTRSNP